MAEATERYAESLSGSPAEEFLDKRKVPRDLQEKFRLGFVDECLPGHSRYDGMLAIPYLRPSPEGEFTCSIRFRCIEDHDHVGHGKYQTVPGDRGRMFNTAALLSGSDVIGVTEGELDAVMAEASGIPSVGIPGAQHWKQHYRGPFQGYDVVYIFSDGDEPGHALAKTIMKDLANAKHIPMPDGHDVSSAVLTRGFDYLKERIK